MNNVLIADFNNFSYMKYLLFILFGGRGDLKRIIVRLFAVFPSTKVNFPLVTENSFGKK